MSYDQTLLYSGSTNVKTVTLSEPLSAFERFAICVSPNVIWESEVSANCNFHRFDRYGSWNTDGYFIWPTNYVVSNDCKKIDVNHFQMLMQVGTSAQLRTFGFNNTANNCNCIIGVWGINRKDHVDEEGLGSPGEGWQEYNETPLWSGTDRPEHIHLSEKAIAFERLKVSVGSHGESINTYDVDAPTKYDTWLPLYSYWGTNLGSYYLSMHRYKFLGETDELSAVSGKTWQLGSAAAIPYTAAGNYTSTESHVRKPLIGIWGINKKPARTVHVLDGDHGSASASMTSGYEGEPVTLTSTPDEGWYTMGYNISGATLSGNQFMFGDEDVTVQPLFTDQGYHITYLTDGHGTLTGPEIAIPGEEVELSAQYNDYYRFNNYEVSGGTISGNKLQATGPCTVKANFKLNRFTASGAFEKGSNFSKAQEANFNIGPYYCTRSYSTSNVPSSWYSTSNRWKPTGDISGYSITINGKMGMSTNLGNVGDGGHWGSYTATIFAGKNRYQATTVAVNEGSTNFTYNKTQTTSVSNVLYGVSAVGSCPLYKEGFWTSKYGQLRYSASLTNGTWKATGVIK